MRVPRSRLVELMAWFSVCLLVGAWAPTLDTWLRHVWGVFGLFGLIAAFGLESRYRIRLSQERQREMDQTLARYDNAMERIRRQAQMGTEVRKATKRIAEFVASQCATIPEQSELDDKEGGEQPNFRSEERAKCLLPIELLISDGAGGHVSWAEDDSHMAYIRDISPSGIGLLLSKPVDARQVVLRIPLGDESMSLSVGLLWCRPAEEGWFASGGRIAEVIAVTDTPCTLPLTKSSISREPEVSCSS